MLTPLYTHIAAKNADALQYTTLEIAALSCVVMDS